MNPNIVANQQRLFMTFIAELRPHVRRDSSLPRRIKEIMARHRAIGSRDRKLYRELIYTWLRYFPWVDPLLDAQPDLATKIIAWLAPDLKPTAPYRAAHCADWPEVPPTLSAKSEILRSQATCNSLPAAHYLPSALLPDWFREHCPAAFESPHLDAINSRASVWVRLQCNDRSIVLDEFRARQWTFEEAPDFPDALCLPPNAEVAGSDAYRRGFIEIQDLGSQLVLACAPITPGTRWLDACAGAGGKSLQLARMLGQDGHVDATDIRPDILDELADRAKRARLDNITIIPPFVIARSPAKRDDEAIQPFQQVQGSESVDKLDRHCAPRDDKAMGELYDGVLVDAPCSGSGTWRRQPHLKWYLQPDSIAKFTKLQLEILTANSPRVKPGGHLIYATCSLSHQENRDVVAAFLSAHPQFKPEPAVDTHGGAFDGLGTTLLPGTRNTDGFYVAILRHT